jgi:hypothetical protein
MKYWNESMLDWLPPSMPSLGCLTPRRVLAHCWPARVSCQSLLILTKEGHQSKYTGRWNSFICRNDFFLPLFMLQWPFNSIFDFVKFWTISLLLLHLLTFHKYGLSPKGWITGVHERYLLPRLTWSWHFHCLCCYVTTDLILYASCSFSQIARSSFAA